MKKQIKTFSMLCVFCFSCVLGQPHQFHRPNDLMTSIKTDKKPGAKIYQAFCANCHDKEPLIEINAPKFRHIQDWTVRLKQNPKQLFQNVNEGLNAMPPRGGCFECSDELLQQAINFMLPSPPENNKK